jgi:glycerophosphoryl diester phosphodiesterase
MSLRIAFGFALTFTFMITTAACRDGDEATVARVIGHRGSGTSSDTNPLPENTVPSIARAMADGADGVEIDVQRTADGVLVLMHDFEVDHTTNGTGCVSALDAEAISALDAGAPSRLGEGFVVPTLRGVLDALPAGVLDIELKVTTDHATCAPTDREATVSLLLEDVANFPRERLVVSSFDAEILRLVRAADPTITIALIASRTDAIATAETEGFDAVALLFLVVNEDVIADAHARGLDIWVWTLDSRELAESLLLAGVDAIITDAVPVVRDARARVVPGT